MRYGPGHKEEARARILAAAGRGFRTYGFGRIGVDGLAKEARVTSGAFYGHFPSKEVAFREVVAAGIEELRIGVENFQVEFGEGWIEPFVDFYLGPKRLCDLGASCALQSLTSDVQRANDETRLAFEAEIRRLVEVIAAGLSDGTSEKRHGRAWALLSILSGSVTLARSMADPAMAEAVAVATRGAALAICRGVGEA